MTDNILRALSSYRNPFQRRPTCGRLPRIGRYGFILGTVVSVVSVVTNERGIYEEKAAAAGVFVLSVLSDVITITVR